MNRYLKKRSFVLVILFGIFCFAPARADIFHLPTVQVRMTISCLFDDTLFEGKRLQKFLASLTYDDIANARMKALSRPGSPYKVVCFGRVESPVQDCDRAEEMLTQIRQLIIATELFWGCKILKNKDYAALTKDRIDLRYAGLLADDTVDKGAARFAYRSLLASLRARDLSYLESLNDDLRSLGDGNKQKRAKIAAAIQFFRSEIEAIDSWETGDLRARIEFASLTHADKHGDIDGDDDSAGGK